MNKDKSKPRVMIPTSRVGIIGYGSYVPRYRLPASEVSRVWHEGSSGEPVAEKAVAGPDEDVATMSIEAARNALSRSCVDPQDIGAVWVGSETHPYAVKPTSTIVAEAIGAVPNTQAADWQFACKAGTEAMQAAIGFVAAGMAPYTLAIGMDTAQGRPGNALEYTAGAGGAAFILGTAEESVCAVDGSLSYVTDTPDFWRRQYKKYPEHGERFTGEPAYFQHTITAARSLMEEMNTTPDSYTHVVFHQPNTKYPQRVGKLLGFMPQQLQTGLLAPMIGNTYAGATFLGLSAVLDVAQPGDLILIVSYGSGAGSDAFQLRTTQLILERQALAPKTQDYIARRRMIDYATYVRYSGQLVME